MLHILLVEDDVDLATTIVEYLALENMHCDYARTGAHGLQLAGAPACGTAYDAIVLDLNPAASRRAFALRPAAAGGRRHPCSDAYGTRTY